MTICLRLSDRRHSMLSCYRIASALGEHIDIASSAACKVPIETKSIFLSQVNRIAIVSNFIF
jgi:hypothetical protein